MALNHPKNIHFVASSTSTLTSLFGFAFHKKGQNFHPIDFGDSSLFTQSRRRRRWEIYSHTRSPNISAASVGCGKNMKHYTLLFFFRGATKSPPAGRNFRYAGCNNNFCEAITLGGDDAPGGNFAHRKQSPDCFTLG